LIVSYPQRSDLLSFIRRQAPLQPTVLIGANDPGIAAFQVTEDNRAAGSLAARHFLERGHFNFAWLSAYGGRVSNDRKAGFAAALDEAGFKYHAMEYKRDKSTSLNWRHRQAWLARQLRTMPKPLACYVLDDQLAAEAIEVCLVNGWRVPEDIAVMGTGNIEISCECSHVPISSIDLAEEAIAVKAAELASPQLRQAVDYIKLNLRRSFSFEQLAEEVGVSRRTLYNLFQRHLSRSPAAFVVKARLDRARQLMAASPNQTLANISAQSGLGSPRTLTRLLKRVEGINARKWKKALKTSPRSSALRSV